MSVATPVDITDFGAVGDGSTVNTTAIRAALAAAVAPGGSRHVVIPPGRFVTGTLEICDTVWLEFRPGAELVASRDLADYPAYADGGHKDLQPYHFLVLRGANRVRISGPGRLDGSGPAFWEKDPLPSGWFRELDRRPSPMIVCDDCRDLVWEGVEIANSPGWTLHLKRCENVQVRGVTIRNCLFGPNTDGIDIDGCRDVRISDCVIEAGDDAIVLKTTPEAQTCERVTVTNCVITTRCRALKLGAHESFHDMRDVVFSNCVVHESVAIFALYTRNGANLENIAVTNIVGRAFANPDYNQPIHLDAARVDPTVRPGRIRNVLVSNFLCHSNGRILLTGESAAPLENITLRGVQFHPVDVFDPFPHGRTALGNQFSPATPEARAARAALVIEHARRVTIDGFSVCWPEDLAVPFHGLWARDVEDGWVHAPGLRASPADHAVAALERAEIQGL